MDVRAILDLRCLDRPDAEVTYRRRRWQLPKAGLSTPLHAELRRKNDPRLKSFFDNLTISLQAIHTQMHTISRNR
jgi:hypothetical protein